MRHNVIPGSAHRWYPHLPVARRAGIALTAAALLAMAGCGSPGVVVVTVTPSAAPTTDGGSTTGTRGAADTGITGAATGAPTGSTAPSAGTAISPQESTGGAASRSDGPPTISSPAPKPVHVATFEGDGETFGVGMAVVALFTVAPTDATAFERAATVTVNGAPATGAWFWQDSSVPGYPVEALYRQREYWPAHASISVDLPVRGLSAGSGLIYDDNLTLDFAIGDAHISHVSNTHHVMTVTSNDSVVENLPVSLGSASTPTYDGVKVVMTKGSIDPATKKPRPNGTVEMKSDPGEAHGYDIMVPWSVRITNSGEFVHAASWNGGNIGSRNTSHGCTNLTVKDAEWFYDFSLPGDVIDYPDANPTGAVQPPWDGWGWWNVPWAQWQTGGLLASA